MILASTYQALGPNGIRPDMSHNGLRPWRELREVQLLELVDHHCARHVVKVDASLLSGELAPLGSTQLRGTKLFDA